MLLPQLGVVRVLQLAAERTARVVGVLAEGRRVGEGLRAVALGEKVLVERCHLDHLARVRVRGRVRVRVRVKVRDSQGRG